MNGKRVQATRRELDAVEKAEEAIAAILVKLEEETGKSVDDVHVDTRNFAQLATEIFLTDRARR